MKTIVILFLGAFLCGALGDPLRYRQAQQVRASARQTASGIATQAELGNEESQNDDIDMEQITEPTLTRSAPVPGPVLYPPQAYPPQGWRPFGQLLVLPVAVRENQAKENLESTTTVESSTFNDAETTEETPTTESLPSNEELQDVETSEPKVKKTEAHKKPPTIIIIKGKKVGELKVESKQETKEESTEANTNTSTTESADEDEATTKEATSTVDPKSENLETTSEPEAEAVDVEKSNEEGKQVNNAQLPAPVPQAGFFIQLPDGTFQRIVYVAPQATATQLQQPMNFVPQPQQPAGNFQIQQLNQAPNSPFGFNPITNPRIVTFSTAYNAW